MKKLISTLFFLLGLAVFCVLIFLSSPYRTLRPYALFGAISSNTEERTVVNGITALLVPYAGGDFYMEQIPVTVAAYRTCEESENCFHPHYRDSYTQYYTSSFYDGFPVTFVTWIEARTYCQAFGGDLPTAAQWEAAAGSSVYAWGDSLPVISRANVDGYYQWLTPAGWLPEGASSLGFLDLNGNVREWILDEDPDHSDAKGLKGASFQDSFSSAANESMVYHWESSAGFNRGFRCVYPAESIGK